MGRLSAYDKSREEPLSTDDLNADFVENKRLNIGN
jgi:hypothetical protein